MKTKKKKDWQGREKSLEELHYDSKLWISEINFINDEIRFLEHLLSSNYIDYLDAGLYKKIVVFVNKISTGKKTANTLRELIYEQERVLSDLIDSNSISSNKNYFSQFTDWDFIKNYKEFKKQIFDIVENVMRKKEQKKLV